MILIPESNMDLLKQCKVDTFRASGKGGQHVNKTESAVRITHMPTAIVVTCQDERSQHRNKEIALSRLRKKLEALNKKQKKTNPYTGHQGLQRKATSGQKETIPKKGTSQKSF